MVFMVELCGIKVEAAVGDYLREGELYTGTVCQAY
jgi:hypothetical protein